jgi:hypothetical protein
MKDIDRGGVVQLARADSENVETCCPSRQGHCITCLVADVYCTLFTDTAECRIVGSWDAGRLEESVEDAAEEPSNSADDFSHP